MTAPGLGPWFCALLQRDGTGHVVVATLPHLACEQLNARMLVKVGPFGRRSDAVRFSAQWQTTGTPGHEEGIHVWRMALDDESARASRVRKALNKHGAAYAHAPLQEIRAKMKSIK